GMAGYSPRAGGAVCVNCANGALPLARDGLLVIEGLLQRPLAEAHEAGFTERGAREALGVITASYEYHGGFRLRTLASQKKSGPGQRPALKSPQRSRKRR